MPAGELGGELAEGGWISQREEVVGVLDGGCLGVRQYGGQAGDAAVDRWRAAGSGHEQDRLADLAGGVVAEDPLSDRGYFIEEEESAVALGVVQALDRGHPRPHSL